MLLQEERSIKHDRLLAKLLGCNIPDLDVLDRVEIDWSEIELDDISLNEVLGAVIKHEINWIDQTVNDCICELEAIALNSDGLDDDQETELAALQNLSPAEDIGFSVSGENTQVYFKRNGSLYSLYLGDAVKAFNHGTGFQLAI